MPPPRTKSRSQQLPDASLLNLLGFFYPIHYRIGMALELAMCQGLLKRQQVAIIWLIASEVGPHGSMRRKLIEQRLNDWFESRNSHVTHLLNELSSPPLLLVTQATNPESGREKLVTLTDAGRDYLNVMTDAALSFFRQLLPHLSDQELRDGIHFLGRAFGPPTAIGH
jgi:DNA-binding MarR family transcriptional regulator